MEGAPLSESPAKKEGFGSLFRKQPLPQDTGIKVEMVNLDRRIRVLEEGLTNVRRRFRVTEENVLNKNKHFSTEIKTINSEISELKKEIMEIKDKMLMLIREVQECAKKGDVKVLEKYINMWNPVNFVTRNEVDDIVRESLKKRES